MLRQSLVCSAGIAFMCVGIWAVPICYGQGDTPPCNSDTPDPMSYDPSCGSPRPCNGVYPNCGLGSTVVGKGVYKSCTGGSANEFCDHTLFDLCTETFICEDDHANMNCRLGPNPVLDSSGTPVTSTEQMAVVKSCYED